MDKEKVRNAAKALMDEFMAALEGVEEEGGRVGIERADSVRKAGKCEPSDWFSERMMKNAPATKDRYVVAEKKKW